MDPLAEPGGAGRYRVDALCVVAGAAAPLGFAPLGWYPLLILSLCVLFEAWLRASPRRAAARGLLFGIAYFGVGVSWVQVSVHQFGLPVLAFSVTVTAVFVLFMASYLWLLGLSVALLGARRPAALRLLVIYPAAWVLFEYLRGVLFTGFPWLLLGYSQTDSPLAGFAPVGGVYAVSLSVALTAGALLALRHLRSTAGRCCIAAGLVLIWAGGQALGTVAWTRSVGAPVTAALIQGAIPQTLKWRPSQRQASLRLYRQLTEPYWDADVIVWPETAIPAFAFEVDEFLSALDARARGSGASLLVGLPVMAADRRHYFNAVLALGAAQGEYHKRHLVPFGEYLPFRDLLAGVLQFLDIPFSGFSAGGPRQAPVKMDARDTVLGITICYEAAYGSLVRKSLPEAGLLVNVSNDAWFGDSLAPAQHLQIARMRALENGRYLLRATNTGISAVIGARGEIIGRSPQFRPHALAAAVELRTGATPFTRMGDLAVLVLAASMLLAGVIGGRPRPLRTAPPS